MKPINQTPFLPSKGIIRSIIPLAKENHLFEIGFKDAGDLKNCKPGQFVQLWVPGVGEAPISVCSGSVSEKLELCVHRIGRVTGALFQMTEGDWVGVRGPYGNGFPVDKFKGKNIVLIAGGLGIAPIRSLLQYLLNNRESYGKIIVIYGMRHSSLLLFRQEFKWYLRRGDLEVYVAAEEIIGPDLPAVSWQLGRVTDLIEQVSIDTSFEAAICGPPVMYKYVISKLLEKGIRKDNIWVSLERHMKCGIGKCGHCFIGGTFACKSGPVFNLLDAGFIPEADECSVSEVS